MKLATLSKVFLATANKGKFKELLPFAQNLFSSAVIEPRAALNIVENGNSFLENAKIKTMGLYEELKNSSNFATHSGFAILADDSGLVVEALGGRPGILSARYAGPHASDAENIEKLLREMATFTELRQRQAYFHCSLCLLVQEPHNQKPQFYSAEGQCEGSIAFMALSGQGFGYDPVFISKEFNKVFSELSLEEKNAISHRGRAFQNLKVCLERG